MLGAEGNLNDVKNHSDQMTPEDRVSHTMELQEDVAAKVQIIKKCSAEELDLLPQGDKVPQEDLAAKVQLIKKCIAEELDLLPQGDKVPQDAEDHKAELKRIDAFVTDLQKKVMATCD